MATTTEKTQVEVLLAQGQALFREGLRALLNAHDDQVKVVATAKTAREAVARARVVRPQVALLEVGLPDESGIDACREIRLECTDTAVVMLGSPPAEEWVFAAIAAGAAGCLLKEEVDGRGLTETLRLVASGKSILDPSLAPGVFERLRVAAPQLELADERLAQLTRVERRILSLVADGFSNREIASEVGYAVPTVKKYVSSILAKLGVCRRTQAVAYLRSHTPQHHDLNGQVH